MDVISFNSNKCYFAAHHRLCQKLNDVEEYAMLSNSLSSTDAMVDNLPHIIIAVKIAEPLSMNNMIISIAQEERIVDDMMFDLRKRQVY